MTELSFAHANIKTLPYSGVFDFFRIFSSSQNLSPPPHPNHCLKIQWEILFLIYLYDDQNAQKFFFRIRILTFWFEICFQNQFRILGTGTTEITQITPIGDISIWPLPKVWNWFAKKISNQNVHISNLIFFGAFGSSQKNVQKWIFHCIFQKWFWWGRTDFVTNFFF